MNFFLFFLISRSGRLKHLDYGALFCSPKGHSIGQQGRNDFVPANIEGLWLTKLSLIILLKISRELWLCRLYGAIFGFWLYFKSNVTRSDETKRLVKKLEAETTEERLKGFKHISTLMLMCTVNRVYPKFGLPCVNLRNCQKY